MSSLSQEEMVGPEKGPQKQAPGEALGHTEDQKVSFRQGIEE